VGSTPTRFRQILDDSIAFVGVEPCQSPFRTRVLFPSCSQIQAVILPAFSPTVGVKQWV